MHTTKFRGQILNGPRKGEWVYGYYYATPLHFLDKPDVITHCIIDKEGSIYKVDPNTVGQYTGLHDKSDNEIYKDDMLKDSLGTGKVIWMAPSFVVVDYNGKVWNLGGGMTYPENHIMKETEIIGNSHDNPDLLTQ